MSEGLALEDARQLARKASITAFCVAVGLIVLGQQAFRFLGITVDDLKIAGGIILLLISIHDLIYDREKRKEDAVRGDVGIVPLGIPIMVGPAALTTSLVLADTMNRGIVIAALTSLLAICWLMMHNAHRVNRFIPPSLIRAFGKVMSLLLAAIAVAMLRTGIMAFVLSAKSIQ